MSGASIQETEEEQQLFSERLGIEVGQQPTGLIPVFMIFEVCALEYLHQQRCKSARRLIFYGV